MIVCGTEIVSCELAGGCAVLDLGSGTYFSLNSVGAFVWELLNKPVAVGDIHKALIARYDVERDKCYDDLLRLLRELADAGLIVNVDATAR